MSYAASAYSVHSSGTMPSAHLSFNRAMPTSSYRAASIYGGAGGQGTRISSASYAGVRSGMEPGAFQGGRSSVSARASASASASASARGQVDIMGNEKGAMQNLNDRLASYLETVRNLEQANNKLEQQIREVLEKRGPDGRNYSQYNPILDELRKKVFDMTVDNARLVLQIDNSRLAADDFRVKFEYELNIRQSVEADIAGLRKVIDDTNMGRLNMESEIEAVKEELVFLKKNHDNEVMELRNQISQSGVQVDVDAPKGQDLSQVMDEMRANYERIALKNAEELKAWHETQITDVQAQVSEKTEALQGAHSEMKDLHRQVQTLEIELESQRSMKASLEDTVRDIDQRYNMEVEKYNGVIRQLEAELMQLRTNVQQQGKEYEALLNIKMKLEAEIATYKLLLDGGDLKLLDALEDL